MPDTALNFIALLAYALKNYPEKIELSPVLARCMSVARQNDKRPAYFQIAVNDDWVKNAKGKDELIDIYACIKIEREVLDRFNSKVLLPNESPTLDKS